MYYLFGDIHGCFDNLVNLINIVRNKIKDDDVLVFLGDYVDRGKYSYEVIEYLISISKFFNTIFLKGNHEAMFLKYIYGEDKSGIFIYNGGHETIKSYNRNLKSFRVPERHILFLQNLDPFFEGDNFIAVHAGLDPKINKIEHQSEEDIVWIRDEFFRSNKKWDKTIIFGHTPTFLIKSRLRSIYFDKIRNIIGVDTGAVYGGKLTCLRWPDMSVFQC